jgi:hypothetical protein
VWSTNSKRLAHDVSFHDAISSDTIYALDLEWGCFGVKTVHLLVQLIHRLNILEMLVFVWIKFVFSFSSASGFIVSNSRIVVNCVEYDDSVKLYPGTVILTPAKKLLVNVNVSKVRTPFEISDITMSSSHNAAVSLIMNLCFSHNVDKDFNPEFVNAWPVLRPIPATFFTLFNYQQIFARAIDLELLKVSPPASVFFFKLWF